MSFLIPFFDTLWVDFNPFCLSFCTTRPSCTKKWSAPLIFSSNLYSWLVWSLSVHLVLWLLQFASYFTCVWSVMLLLFAISCVGRKCFGVETITNAVWLVYSHLVIFMPFSWRLSHYAYSWCLLHKYAIATVTIHRSGFCFSWVIWHGVHYIWCNACCWCDCYDQSCWLSLAIVNFV